MKSIALQLYSIKELTEVDFLGSLEKVAEAGYDGVEFAGYFNTSARVLKGKLDSLGLKAAGSHLGLDALTQDIDKTLEYSREIGNTYIVCPHLSEGYRNSADAYKKTAELFNKIGEKCKEYSMQLCYHNHEFEFEKYDGKYGLDILMENSQAGLLELELDTFWAEYCNLKSVDFIEKYKERCSLFHIKDMKSLDEKINTEIGKGIMDIKGITAAGKKYNAKWFTVEQEEFEIPQLESIKISCDYLKSIL